MSPPFPCNTALLLSARAFQASPDAVVIGRLDGRVLLMNAAASRMLGCAARGAKPRGFAWFRDRDLRARSRGRPGPGDADLLHRRVEARRADGTRFPASITFTLLGRGRRAAVAAHIRDLSIASLPDGDRGGDVRPYAAGEFSGPESLMARIGHDLNNPLAIVVAQATVLHDLAPDPDVARRAERIMAAAQRAGRIVGSWTMSAPRPPPRLSVTEANAAVRDALASMPRGPEALGVELRPELAPGLPDILADRALLARAVTEVLLAAREAVSGLAGEGTVAVRTSVAGADFVIDVASAPLGPGLDVCRAILADHGGRIESLDGPDGRPVQRIAIPLPRASHPEAGRPPALSVLIVDDEPDVAEALADVVGLLGHEAVVAASAEAALHAVRGRRFDAAIVDLHMPHVDGVALRGAVAALDPRLAGRFAIVTGDSTGPVAARLSESCPTLRKPFTLNDVRALLLRLATR